MNDIKGKARFALIFPLLCLLVLTVYKGIKVSTGKTLILPITGYDPRDLLSGHYLTYRIKYNCSGLCENSDDDNYDFEGGEVYLCVNQINENEVESEKIYPDDIADYQGRCTAVIKGRCGKWGRFEAGIEKFFIPEAKSLSLDRAVRKDEGRIIVKVDRNGNAVIKDLLIGGKSWREYAEPEEK